MNDTAVEIEVQQPGDALFNQSFDLIKQAMKTVKQEIVITLLDGTPHIIYLHDAVIQEDGSLRTDWSTPSTDRKDELGVELEKCIAAQFNLHIKRPPARKRAKPFAF